jgi:hypothetical protein
MRLSAISFLAVLAAAPALAQAAAPSPDATLWGSVSKGAAGELQLYLGQYPTGQYAACSATTTVRKTVNQGEKNLTAM